MGDNQTANTFEEVDPVLLELIKEDSLLPPHIKSFGEVPEASRCNVILLTGLTGNLGPYLLKNLLKRSNIKVYCLVRKSALEHAEKLVAELQMENDVEERVILIPGDLSVEKFGIEATKYDDLCLEVNAVVHSGVKSHHLEMYQKNIGKNNDLRTVNVLGTIRVLEFATTGTLKRILYASSILACNRISDTETTMSEELIEDDNYGDGLGQGYAISKFIGDKLMSQAIRRGIPVIVFRFPLIIFDSQTGHMNFKNNHFFYLLMAVIETGKKPEYPSAFPAIPVDICADISIDLFFKDDVPEGIYNLLNPHNWNFETGKLEGSKIISLPPIRKVQFTEFSNTLVALGDKSILYPFRMIYFDKDAQEMLATFSLTSKLLLTEEGGKYLENVSSKFRKYVLNIDQLIETPLELSLKLITLGKEAGYCTKQVTQYLKEIIFEDTRNIT